jgi:hypothetical protein
MTKPRKRKARIRQRKASERRPAIALYLAELRRAKVPRSTVKAAKVAMLILLGAR